MSLDHQTVITLSAKCPLQCSNAFKTANHLLCNDLSQLPSIYCEPGPVLGALHVLFCLSLQYKTVLPGRGAGGEKSSEANGRKPRPRNEGEDPLQGRALKNGPFDAELHGEDREPGVVTEPGVRATEQHTLGGSQRDTAWLILICVEPIYWGK